MCYLCYQIAIPVFVYHWVRQKQPFLEYEGCPFGHSCPDHLSFGLLQHTVHVIQGDTLKKYPEASPSTECSYMGNSGCPKKDTLGPSLLLASVQDVGYDL